MINLDIKTSNSPLLSSNMYTIRTNNRLIIIDPWISKELEEAINNNLLKVDYTILTHEHYDHISGVNWIKRLSGCQVICNEDCAVAINNPKLNFSEYFEILMEILPDDKKQNQNIESYTCSADFTFRGKISFQWEKHKIDLVSTPGHSGGSICILIDNKYLFSGDSLLKDCETITRLKGGNLKKYKESTMTFFKSLSPNTIVYPGHYGSFILAERLKNDDKLQRSLYK